MRIVFTASEAFPLAKVGGLADVTSSLALALSDLGHQPCLILPRYSGVKAPSQDVRRGKFVISSMGRDEQVSLGMTSLREKIPVYLVENERYFGTEEVYTQNELERFLFFSLTIPVVVSQLDLRPDVVHCHDWHTALVPFWLKRARMKTPCVFTIHNLAYQGSFDQQFLFDSGLSSMWHNYVPPDVPLPSLSFMSQGILLADIVNTVSPTYASEILTPQYGVGLEQLLNYRRDELSGIVNGIDYETYNPATDRYLASNYDATRIHKRTGNKLALQRRAGLPQNMDIPLIGMVSRLEEQKGIDLVLEAIDRLVAETRAQMLILGQGRDHYQRMLSEAALKYPERLSVFVVNDEPLAHLIYGAADVFLMPSRFEPCGLGQLIAMRYGAIPVVRHTGGLADTVKDMAEGTPDSIRGNGFVFRNYAVSEMLEAIKRAEKSFYHRAEWRNLMRRNMKLDFSWQASARKYEEIYLRAQKMSQIH